jgi:putative ubiquitin-RnfH superfamily antitoxin RatB of RatAB toxin-antitoxin module
MKGISIRVKLAAPLTAFAGYGEKDVVLPECATVRDAIQSAGLSENIAKICAGQMNGLPVDDTSVLRDNDRLLLYMKIFVRGG